MEHRHRPRLIVDLLLQHFLAHLRLSALEHGIEPLTTAFREAERYSSFADESG